MQLKALTKVRKSTVRAQIRRISDHTNGDWSSGFVLRWGGPTGGYWIEVRSPNRFWLGHMNRWVLRSAALPFNVDEQELIIRVDAVGDQIKCWCWPVGEPMPKAPQITLIDNVTPDGTFALYAGTQGGKAIYRWVEAVSLEVPIVDFNGDGTVDIDDLLRLIESWGRDDPAVDIVPDGVVDQKDLEVLMEHWQQDANDPTLLAHWALDEAQGKIACDSAGLCDAALVGDPTWDPDGGQIDGALQLDGLDDCAVAPFVVNPADGPFSVFAWVKGGAPGQVLISQAAGMNWLLAAPTDGCLVTEAKADGHSGSILRSQTAITDGNWHRVGFVWDGASRILYVDGGEVARGPQSALASSTGGLYIGADSKLTAGAFWSGLIDDVRIYNRVVQP